MKFRSSQFYIVSNESVKNYSCGLLTFETHNLQESLDRSIWSQGFSYQHMAGYSSVSLLYTVLISLCCLKSAYIY